MLHLQRACCLLVLLSSILACSSLPDASHVEKTAALPATQQGVLSDFAENFAERYPEAHSGFSILTEADQAMYARLALIDSAQSSLDVQYFIWENDAAGTLLYDRLMKAADRGVRVRLLVDDLALRSTSEQLSIASKHPNLDIHLFNPNPGRDNLLTALASFFASFSELNRRMHNKLLIADSRVAIVGGRNIGNPYFGLSDNYNFVDLDVLTTGKVVPELSAAFDEYWNDDIVFPSEAFSDSVSLQAHQAQRQLLDDAMEQLVRDQELGDYPAQVQDWQVWLDQRSESWVTGTGHFMQDTPVEVEGESLRLIDMLAYMVAPTQQEVILASPYLIPVDNFLEEIQADVERGVEVHLVTNSLGSNNHTIAHSHYRKYRKDLLNTGARLYEFNHQPGESLQRLAEPELGTAKFISMHTKAMVADQERSFVGSLNFDPRALLINTENGLLIESPDFAVQLRAYLLKIKQPQNAYELRYKQQQQIRWHGEEVLERQPAQGSGQRFKDSIYRWIPVESQL